MYRENTQRYEKSLNSPVRSNYTLYRNYLKDRSPPRNLMPTQAVNLSNYETAKNCSNLLLCIVPAASHPPACHRCFSEVKARDVRAMTKKRVIGN